ncbi:MAG: hypothetical protein JST54_21420 [Deltaproteobacteria bacterium]|nr:hypothetical protein [Deltaproteobacteria bacterium]
MKRVALGFSVHTGWAALVAVSQTHEVVDRRRVEMIPGSDPEAPPFVYHAARHLPLAKAERFLHGQQDLARSRAREALQAMARDFKLVAAAIPVGERPVTSPLASILANHSLIHAAEGVLYRQVIREALEELKIDVCEIPTKQLTSRAAKVLKVSEPELVEQVVTTGRAAGRPWAKDQQQAFMAALIALAD